VHPVLGQVAAHDLGRLDVDVVAAVDREVVLVLGRLAGPVAVPVAPEPEERDRRRVLFPNRVSIGSPVETLFIIVLSGLETGSADTGLLTGSYDQSCG
jgi:hypothetical protein